jgi:protocatechuate 3,4-dioxygenase beta subunit
MKFLKLVSGILLATALAACGGGGGSAGSAGGGTGGTGGGGTSTDGGSTTTTVGSISVTILSGAGLPTTAISASEIAEARVEVKTAAGAPVTGVVVTYSEVGGSLLSFAPAAKTALTDGQGIAVIEVRAADPANTGATTIAAAATISGTAVTAQKAINISTAPAGGGGDPQLLANALNFLNVNPSDRSIVIQGAGGSGRSESATLRFRVVDTNNAPVKDVVVDFVVVPAGNVTLNIPQATSDAEGVVVTTVSSKTVATAVVVRGTVNGRAITSQSDQLLVTTGVATAAGFDLSATRYNLNSEISGDATTVRVAIVDSNGNPVADGVPVVFTADFGRVGSSAQGGCTTVNGECAVTYVVQNPRPPDGTLATVTGSTRVGDGTTISDVIRFNISRPSLLDFYDNATGGAPITALTAIGCKSTTAMFLGTPGNGAPPQGATLALTSLTTDLTGSVKDGSPVLDNPLGERAPVAIEVDATSILDCDPGSAAYTGFGTIRVRITAGSVIRTVDLDVQYPR